MSRPPSPVSHLCDSHGVLLRREALAMGVDDKALARLVDAKLLVKMRHGVYCDRATFLAADTKERHRLLCRGVMKMYAGHVVLSHSSACVVQGGPDYGLDLSRVHLSHLSGGGRQQARIRHHRGQYVVGDLRRQDDHWVSAPTRAVVETACTDGVLPGLVQANHFLHAELTSVVELRAACARAENWPGSLAHHLLLLLANPLIESVGETRSDHLFFTQALPRPEAQYEIYHPSGLLAARVDFAWPELRVIVEFDGKEKYHRYRRPGETIEQMVTREKAREDLIREITGWTVVRLTWADLDLPLRTAHRIRRAFARATHRAS